MTNNNVWADPGARSKYQTKAPKTFDNLEINNFSPKPSTELSISASVSCDHDHDAML